jgi:hypothetical protein
VAPTATAELTPNAPLTFSLWQAAGRLPGELKFTYDLPAGLALNLETSLSAVGFADGSDGLGYGYTRTTEPPSFNSESRGVVFTDVTGAFPWGAHDKEPAHDAAGFWELLKSDAPNGNDKYVVSSLRATQLAGYSALSGDIELTRGYSFAQLEWSEAGEEEVLPARLYGKSHLIVADVGKRVIMFQIWVGHAPGRAHDTQMNAWLPIALEIANSVTLHSTVPNATARVDGTFSLWPWQMPTGQGLRFDYQVPAGVAPDPGVSTSYAMFMSGAGGQSLTIADLTGTELFGGAEDMPPGGNAADFIESLRAHGYEFPAVTPSQVGGYPSLKLVLADWPPYAWLKWPGSVTQISLAMPSELIVADIGDRVVLVQIAVERSDPYSPRDEAARLAEWIPIANQLVDSLRISVQSPVASPSPSPTP